MDFLESSAEIPQSGSSHSYASETTTGLKNLQDIRSAKNAKDKVAMERITKIPRPPNPFILYRQANHPIVKARYPTLSNNQISIMLGSQWKKESETVKEDYKTRAEKAKINHFKLYPDYQYQPRKPSEKKRRSRKAISTMKSMAATPSETLLGFRKLDDRFIAFDIGSADRSQFRAMLENHNSEPQNSHPSLADAPLSGVLPSQESSDDAAYINSLLDWSYFSDYVGNRSSFANIELNDLPDTYSSNVEDDGVWNLLNEMAAERMKLLNDELHKIPNRGTRNKYFQESAVTVPLIEDFSEDPHISAEELAWMMSGGDGVLSKMIQADATDQNILDQDSSCFIWSDAMLQF